MAPPTSSRKVVSSPNVLHELQEIWQWNADRHGDLHANAYVQMLRKAIASLGSEYDKGGLIDADLGLRYLLVRRKRSGHGHVLVYRVHAETVDVLHALHTAQDWRSKPLDDIEP